MEIKLFSEQDPCTRHPSSLYIRRINPLIASRTYHDIC